MKVESIKGLSRKATRLLSFSSSSKTQKTITPKTTTQKTSPSKTTASKTTATTSTIKFIQFFSTTTVSPTSVTRTNFTTTNMTTCHATATSRHATESWQPDTTVETPNHYSHKSWHQDTTTIKKYFQHTHVSIKINHTLDLEFSNDYAELINDFNFLLNEIAIFNLVSSNFYLENQIEYEYILNSNQCLKINHAISSYQEQQNELLYRKIFIEDQLKINEINIHTFNNKWDEKHFTELTERKLELVNTFHKMQEDFNEGVGISLYAKLVERIEELDNEKSKLKWKQNQLVNAVTEMNLEFATELLKEGVSPNLIFKDSYRQMFSLTDISLKKDDKKMFAVLNNFKIYAAETKKLFIQIDELFFGISNQLKMYKIKNKNDLLQQQEKIAVFKQHAVQSCYNETINVDENLKKSQKFISNLFKKWKEVKQVKEVDDTKVFSPVQSLRRRLG